MRARLSSPRCARQEGLLLLQPKISQRYLIRNHQKMVIADEARALFGGFNIADDYFAPPAGNGWNDMASLLRDRQWRA
jgi:phosphatidylserine/phosphatidylglycerophosphate/cardiolipin synthase-like enzyme